MAGWLAGWVGAVQAALPTVTTTEATAITMHGASTGGNVTADGGEAVTQRGIVFGTTANPTTGNATFVTSGTGAGSYAISLAGLLSPGTTYYVRAFAINASGTAYGNPVQFATVAAVVPPTVTTGAVTEIRASSVRIEGNVTADGGGTVTARGVVLGTQPLPTLASGTAVSAGTGAGPFAATAGAAVLRRGTTYYVRAFATNGAGTAYGAQRVFTAEDGLVAYYRFEDEAGDASGAGNHGTATAAVNYVNGRRGRAAHFSGGAHIAVPDHATLDFTTAMTAAFWLRVDTAGGTSSRRIFDKNTSGSADGYGLNYFAFGATDPRLEVDLLTSGEAGAPPIVAYTLNEWVHLAIVTANGTQILYRNGIETDRRAMVASLPTNDLPLVLGAAQGGTAGLQGDLDDFRLYNRALGAAEIAALAESGRAVHETFDTLDTATRWEAVGGTWAAANGQVTGEWSVSAAQTDQGNLLLRGQNTALDYDFSFTATLAAGSHQVALYHSPGNRYTISFDAAAPVSVGRRQGGANYAAVTPTIQRTFSALSTTQPTTVTVSRRGATFQVFANGRFVLEFQDTVWSGALRTGLGVYGSAVFDAASYRPAGGGGFDTFAALDTTARWEVVGGAWSASGGRVTGGWSLSDAFSDQANLLLRGQDTAADFDAAFLATLTGGQGFALYASPGNKYNVNVSGTEVAVERRVAGTAAYSVVATAGYAGGSTTTYTHVRLAKRGAVFSVLVDGAKVLDFTDANWGGRLRLGLKAYGTHSYEAWDHAPVAEEALAGETLDFASGALPAGWQNSTINFGGFNYANGRMNVYPNDARLRIERALSVPAGAKRLEIRYRGNMESGGLGGGNYVAVGFGGTPELTFLHAFGTWIAAGQMVAGIQRGSTESFPYAAQQTMTLAAGTYSYVITIEDGKVSHRATTASGATAFAYEAVYADLRLADANRLALQLYTSTTPALWMDDVSITAVGEGLSAPTITTQPATRIAVAGSDVTLTVAATGGGLGYQWSRNGATLAGATGTSLTLGGAQLADAGQYQVVVVNALGAVTSEPANVYVGAPGAPYRLTEAAPAEGDLAALATAQFGAGATVADWDEIKASFGADPEAFYRMIGLGDRLAAMVVKGGQRHFSGNRQYFAQRSDSELPHAGFLAHDQMGTLYLGSWYGYRMPIVVKLPVTAPTIGTQPASVIAQAGATVTLAVAANGGGLSYQWRKGGTALAGATAATLGLGNAQYSDSGLYDVVVSNAAGTVTSETAGVHVGQAGAPYRLAGFAAADADLAALATAQFGAGATVADWDEIKVGFGADPEAFYRMIGLADRMAAMVTRGGQRYFSGNRQYFAQRSEAGLPHAGFLAHDQTGTMYLGSWYGYRMPVVVKLPVTAPTIAVQPANQILVAGAGVVLSVSASGGSLSYQWRKGGTVLAGATAATLALGNVGYGDSGLYEVTVANAAGSVTSDAASVYVGQAGAPYRLAGFAAADADLATVAAQYGAGAAVADWDEIKANFGADPEVFFRMIGLGDRLAAMVVKGGQRYFGDNRQYFAQRSDGGLPHAGFLAHDQIGAMYLGSWYGYRMPVVVKLPVTAPAIAAQPAHRIATAGASVSLSVTATGGGLSYQWFRQGVAVAGATGGSLALAAAQFSDSGLYTVRVSNAAGAVTSEPASVYIGQAGATYRLAGFAPAEADLAALVTAQFGAGATVADWDEIKAVHGANLAAFYQMIGLADRLSAMVTKGGQRYFSGNRQYFAQRSESGLPHAGFLAHDQAGALYLGSWYGYQMPVVAKVPAANTPPTVANIADRTGNEDTVSSFSVAIGDAETAVAALVLTATSSNAVLLPAGGITVSGTGASRTVALTPAANQSGTTTVTLTVTDTGGLTASDTFVFTVSPVNDAPTISDIADQTIAAGSGATTGDLAFVVGDVDTPAASLAVTAVSSNTTLVPVAGIAFGGSGANRTVRITPASGQSGTATITVTVSDGVAPGTSDSFVLAVTPGGIAPSITTPPANRVVGIGAGTTLAVVAAGTGPLTYQWRKDGGAVLANGGRISGATSATLSIADVQLADSGHYTVTVAGAVAPAATSGAGTGVLTVVDARGDHSAAAGYLAGGTVTVSNTLTYAGTATGLGWSVLLPSGWSFAAGGGTQGDVKPATGATGLLEWAWTSIPASPVSFTYTLNVPAGTTGEQQLAALLVLRRSDLPGALNAAVRPDPLIVRPITHHSADTDRNWRLSLVELTRVIELYNTRNGSVRTGAYKVQDTPATEDGFAQDPGRTAGAAATLARHHSGDSDRDGRMSLVELTRVIELYNYRVGSVRTGDYRVQSGTEDGYAPGATAGTP